MNGVGGATSNTSKTAIIGPSDSPDYDVTYTFGQVSIDQPLIDYRGNCGNISSAVWPFAIDEGLVPATGSETIVRFLNTNTGKVIVAHVATKDGRFDPIGDLEIPGVPGSGSRIQLDYLDPGGAVTGRVLPTGHAVDVVTVGGTGYEISLVDAANPLVYVRMQDVGMTGIETPAEIDRDEALLDLLLAIRAEAGVLAGIGATATEVHERFPSVPKLALVASR